MIRKKLQRFLRATHSKRFNAVISCAKNKRKLNKKSSRFLSRLLPPLCTPFSFVRRNILKLSVFAVVVLFAIIGTSFYTKAEYAKFYPAACLGGWQNPKNAEGKPELSPGAEPSEFNDTNSATLLGAASQIFCGSFIGEIPKDAEMKTLLVKLSWMQEGGARDDAVSKNRGGSENLESAASDTSASSTVTVNAGDAVASSTQAILDAPEGSALEIHLEDKPMHTAPSSDETSAVRNEESKTKNQEPAVVDEKNKGGVPAVMDGGAATETVPTPPAESQASETPAPTEAPPPAPEAPTSAQNPETTPSPTETTPSAAPAESAPVSLFDRFFQQVFAEEMETVSDAAVTSTPEITTDAESSTTNVMVDETATTTEQPNIETFEQTLPPPPTSLEFLEVLYTLDGTEWHSLGKVSRTEWKSEFNIPVSEWGDISKLQISVQSLPSLDELPKVYLDGMWLEAEYEDLEPKKEEVLQQGTGTVSSVATIESAASSIAVEEINSKDAYVVTLDNPGETPDYKYQFTGKGVRLLVKREEKWKELMSGVDPIPEYKTISRESGIGNQESTTTGGVITTETPTAEQDRTSTSAEKRLSETGDWQAYDLAPLTPDPDAKDGWVKKGSALVRTFTTTEDGTPEIFTETWDIPENAEDLGSKGPKATYSMTKARGANASLWRMRLAYNGIKDAEKERDDIKDENDYPVRKREYKDFTIDLNDFDNIEGRAGKAKHSFSEKVNGAEAIFFPDGTSGERLIDPTTVTAGVPTGWGHNKTRAVFYTGDRYWLLYYAAGSIYYKSSTDNSTWTATSTLVTDVDTTANSWDTYLVDNTKFDLAYSETALGGANAVTVTINGTSLATSTKSADFLAADVCDSVSIARTPSNNRIFVACRDAAELEVHSADVAGDANLVTSWTGEILTQESVLVNEVTMAPYGTSDTVLVLYEKDGNAANDGIWSRAITRSGGAGTAVRLADGSTQMNANLFGNAVRTASSTFSFVLQDNLGTTGLSEYVWNGSAWSQSVINSGTTILNPSLFYDNVLGDLYAFASTTSGVVYYKKTAGTWGSAITADNGETGNRQNAFPVTQMQMMFPAEQTFLPWAYRLTNGSNFDLKVGTLGLHGTTTQRAYIFLNDDGNSIAATTDTYTRAHSAATSTIISGVKIGERLIARIQVDNKTAGTSTKMYRLQWRVSAGTWADLSTTTAIRYSLSEKGALAGHSSEVPLPTAQVDTCTSGTTYQEGRFVAGRATSSVIALGPNKCTELAFAIETSGAAVNTTYELRLVNGQSGLPFDQAPLNGAYAAGATPTFTTETARTLMYSKEARGATATSSQNAVSSLYTSLAIGTDGFPIISYRGTSNFLEVAHCTDIACAGRTITAQNAVASTYTSLAIGTDGFPVIAYSGASGSLTVAHCTDAACTGRTITAQNAVNSQYISLAIGTDGFPVISYRNNTGLLTVAHCLNTACTGAPTITAQTAVNNDYTSLAIGTDGFPIISYQPNSGFLEVAHCTDIACAGRTATVQNAVSGTNSSLAIGTDGFPVIGYSGGASGFLEINKCLNIACTATTTAVQNGVSTIYTSIAIGTDGFPVISYQNNSTGFLEVAHCTNAACTARTITAQNAVASPYTSIAIGTDGFPVISYQGSSGFLEVTHCGNGSCLGAASSTANLPADASNYDTFLDDRGYTNVATSDNLYDSLTAATSSRLAYNFKKASTTNTDQISVTWEGQVSVSTTTSLQIYNNTTSAWETLQSSTTPTAGSDFTLTGTQTASLSSYYDGSNIVATRLVTGTTTKTTTLKTDQINIAFTVPPAPTLTQRAYIFLNDDGNGIATTTDTYTKSHSAATSSSISNVKIGERLIARIQIDNTGDATSTTQYRLQYDKNDGIWNNVGTTTEIRSALSVKGALWGRPDGVPLPTRQVTTSCSDSTVYQEGRFVAGTATSTAFGIGPSRCTELAYTIETSGATLNQTYRLRVIDGVASTTFATYSNYPTLTIEAARTLSYSKEARGSSATSTQNAVTSTYTSLAIGTDGFPVISHSGAASGFLNIVHCTDITCAGRTVNVQNSVASQYTSLAIGIDGFPVISYRNNSSTFLEVAHCTDIACAGRAINVQNGVASADTSISIGTDGFPVISYSGASTFLEVAHCTDIACAGRTVTVQNAVSSVYTSLAIGTDGFPVIGYRGASGFLEVAHCTDIACAGSPTITVQNGMASSYVTLAIGTDGYPVISYQADGNFVYVAHCTNVACTGSPTITVQNSVNSQYTSLAIGTDGFPVISYAGASNFLEVDKCLNVACTATTTVVQNSVSSLYTSLAIGTDGYPVIGYRGVSNFLEVAHCGNAFCVDADSSTGNLPNTSVNFATFLDDAGYTNVATSDNLYESLTAATSSRLGYNFKKYNSDTSAEITVTWEGQVSVSTTTSLQIFNNTSGLWETLQSSTTPTASADFTLTGNVTGTQYYSSFIAAARLVTGTTTKTTTLKTDQITITFSGAATLTLVATTDSFATLTPGTPKYATTTLSVTSSGASWNVSMYGNNQGSLAASTTLYLSPTSYSIGIPDSTEWQPGSGTTTAGNAGTASGSTTLAFRVMSASGSQPFRSPTWWGSSDVNLNASQYWAGIASTTASNKRIVISSIAAPSAILGTVQYYLDVPASQQAGAYTGDITFTLTDAL